MVSSNLESVLNAPDMAVETVNPDRSAAECRNLLNVFNSIGHVRGWSGGRSGRVLEGDGKVPGKGGPWGTTPSC